MCGICGVCGFEDKSLIKRMNYVIRHRGPDDEGYFVDKDIMLGNRRLSILLKMAPSQSSTKISR